MLEEVRLGVTVVGELNQVSELFLGGKGLHQAGQHGGVFMLHTLVYKTEERLHFKHASYTVCSSKIQALSWYLKQTFPDSQILYYHI